MVASGAFQSALYFSQMIMYWEYLTIEYIEGASFFAKGAYFAVACFIEPGPCWWAHRLLSFFPFLLFFFFFFWLSYMACVILVSRSGIKLTPPAVEVWSPNLLDHQGIPPEVAFCLLSIP